MADINKITPDVLTLAMTFVKGLSADAIDNFLSSGCTLQDFFMLESERMAPFLRLPAKYRSVTERRKLISLAIDEKEFCDKGHIDIIPHTAPDYPMRLQQIADKPTMLYKIGGCNLDAAHIVAVVGTRHADAYGAEFARQLVNDLSAQIEDLVIVSGLAYGIDIAAQKAALEAGTPTVAVLGHSLDHIYPAAHRDYARRIVRDNGALISEYARHIPTSAGTFLARNRIIAGLSDVTVVVESDLRGGAMTTARLAMEYNREVMALPGRITDKYSTGCNELIKRRCASIIRSADDLIELMGWTRRPSAGTQQELPLELSAEQEKVLSIIRDNPDFTVNNIAAAIGTSYASLCTTLFDLEIKGLIITIPGNRYAIAKL